MSPGPGAARRSAGAMVCGADRAARPRRTFERAWLVPSGTILGGVVLKEQLSADIVYAMRTKDADRLRALRLLRASIQNLEVARTDPKNPQHVQLVTEEDLLAV